MFFFFCSRLALSFNHILQSMYIYCIYYFLIYLSFNHRLQSMYIYCIYYFLIYLYYLLFIFVSLLGFYFLSFHDFFLIMIAFKISLLYSICFFKEETLYLVSQRTNCETFLDHDFIGNTILIKWV